MTGEKGPKGIVTAIKVDTASIVAFQMGLFGWMAIFMLVIWPHHGIKIDSPDFWFQMQIGMILGYFTAWPLNRWLVANGIKEKMDHRRHLGEMLGHRPSEALPCEALGDSRSSVDAANVAPRVARRRERPPLRALLHD